MLSLQLKSGDYFTIGEDIAVQVFQQHGSTFQVKVKAPREIPIARGEVLERDGFICTQAGKGSFVAAQDAELARESNLREIEEHLQAAVELSRQIELPAEELQHILQVLIEEE